MLLDQLGHDQRQEILALQGVHRQILGQPARKALLGLVQKALAEAPQVPDDLIYSPTESEVMMNETNDVFTMEDEPIASVMQDMRKGSKWLSAFLESYRPPLDGERYLTDGEVAELLRVSRRTLQEYRNNRVLPFILLGGKVLYPETGLREVLEANYRKPLE